MRNLFFIIIIPVLFLFSCKVDPEYIPPVPVGHLAQVIPQGWPQPKYRFENNEISEERFTLGRALFYERMMSKDNTISCGSCHQAPVAFAHADHEFSHGINDKIGNRNSPGLFNLAWHTSFMHDGGVNHIEVQPLAPISNPVEMGEEINDVMAKLRNTEKYRKMFKDAYGDEQVTTERMFKSIAQFMGLMLSAESKYDHYKKGDAEFSSAELKGYELFVQKCSGCHTEPLFTDFEFRNNGLSPKAGAINSGRAMITRLATDLYKFKTPSLRNVALTYPYMHDGRYATLQQCLDHYTSKIDNHQNLDPILKEYGIPLTQTDKQNLISFLQTLTDYKFIGDVRFADPNTKR